MSTLQKWMIFVLVIFATGLVAAAQNPATTIWFKQAAKSFDQSLVLGNGRIGAMVFWRCR